MSNRCAVVTGGSRGIGRAAAIRLAEGGFDVAVLYQRRSDEADKVVAEIGERGSTGLAIACDVGDPNEVRRAIADVTHEIGAIDTLVCAAGIRADNLAMRLTDDAWSSVLRVNLSGTFHACRAVLPAMVRGRFGRIVNVASVAALSGSPGQANYAASKAGVIGMSRSIAREVASRGITCNVVSPGPVDTEMIADLSDIARERLRGLTAVGRFATSDEVGLLVSYLCSRDAAFVTGAVIPIDGGLAMGM